MGASIIGLFSLSEGAVFVTGTVFVFSSSVLAISEQQVGSAVGTRKGMSVVWFRAGSCGVDLRDDKVAVFFWCGACFADLGRLLQEVEGQLQHLAWALLQGHLAVTHLDVWVHWQHPSFGSAVVLCLCPVVPGSILIFTGCGVEVIDEMVPFGEKLNLGLELFDRAFAAISLRSRRTVELGFLTGFVSSVCVGGGGSAGGAVGAVALASFGGLVFGELLVSLRTPGKRRGVVGRGRLLFRFFFLSVTSSQGSSVLWVSSGALKGGRVLSFGGEWTLSVLFSGEPSGFGSSAG